MQNHTTMKTILANRVKEGVNDWLNTGKRLIPILFLLLFGVGNAWGDTNINFSGGYIYFADTYNVHKGSTQLCGRKSNCSNGDWYTAVTTLNNISHTKLYYTSSLEGSGWSNVCWAGWALISNSSAKSNANTEYWTGSNSTWYSNFDTYGLNSGSTYVITVASASKGASKTTSYLGNSNTQYTSLNHSQTVYKYTSSGGTSAASYTAQSVASGTVTISAYKMTGNGTASNSSNSGTISAAATTSLSKDAAYTGEVTLTASANAGYSFIGWYESTSATTALSTETSYTYNAPNSTKSIYARFKAEETHNVTVYYKYGSTTIKTYTTESAVGVTTAREFTAPDIDGYNFYSYTFGSGLTMKSASTTTNPCRFVTKGSGTYELTVNYTIAPVKLLYGSSTPLNSPSNTAMTYDATNKRFYVDVTTNSSPYYFRFDYNTGTKQFGGAWDTYPNVVEATANGSKVACATEVQGWDNKSSVKFTGLNSSAIRIYFDYFNKQTWITETTYSVTVAAGSGGTTSPSSVTAGKNTTSGDATATPDDDHAFLNWTIPSGVTAASGYSATSNPIRIKATAGSKSITANFQNRWIMKGSGGVLGNWDTDKEMTKSATNTYSVTLALVAGTSYSFKFYDRKTSKWYGKTSTTITKTLGSLTKDITSIVEGSGSTYNMNFTPTLSGDYTFTYNSSSGTLTIGWPDINKLEIISGSGITPGYYDFSGPVGTVYSKSFTFSKNQRYSAKIVYHSDFYTFNSTSDMTIDNHTDWRLYNNVADKICNVYAPVAGTYEYQFNSNNSGNTTLTVVFPTAYTITFGAGDINGSNSTISVTASPTFSSGDYVLASTAVTFNKGTTKDGYEWKGWYSNSDGTGTCHSSTDANWSSAASTRTGNISVYACYNYSTYTVTMTTSDRTGYGSGAPANQTGTYTQAMPTITPPTAADGYCFMGYWDGEEGTGTKYYNANGTSAHAWNKTSGGTLYAYFKKGAISALTLDAAIVAQGNTVGITPTLDPVPVGDKVICWRVLHGNGNPLDDQPTFTWDGTKVTFPASTNSGTYLAEAILRKGTTCGGEVLDSVTVSFQVAGDHVVTVQYKCGDEFIQTSTTATGRPLSWTEITAPDIFGYTFSKWKAGDGITIQGADGSGEKASATINFKATYEGKLTAIYTQKQLIYFKNTLGWSDVYVNFYTEEYWNNPKGSGNQSVTNRNKHMTHIEETDIWYYDYGAASISPSLYVSFTSKSQDNSQYFWGKNPDVNVVYPAHYQDAIHTDKSSENGFKAATPMFVPIAGQSATPLNSYDSGKANYYNRGYWTKYTPGTGYTLEIYNSAGNTLLKSVEFTSDNDLMPMTAVVDLEAGQTYKYQLRRGGTESAGIYYGNSNTMSYSNCTGWEMINTMSPSFSKAGITVNAAGDYVFTLNYAANNSSQYRLRMTVKYPVSMGDFRIVYSDNDTWSRGVAHTLGTWIMKSHTITARANGIDTVSFFISRGHSPEIRWEKATSQSGTAITWGTRGSWLTTGYTDVSESAVYNFKVTQNANGTAISSIERIGKYTGDYYIRTDAANSKWDNYTVDPDHRMTYSEYSIDHGGYSHYYCHWVQTDDRKNVKFCIANDYSPSISDTLTREVASGEWANIGSFIDAGGNILRNANVRFMWNQSTNKISRAYIDGAQGPGSNNFLKMLSSDSKIKDLSGTIKTEVYFQDNENWIYETNIQAQANAKYKLVSNWGTSPVITQYFKGTISSTETLITGSGSDFHVIRVIYDFKTNRIIAAWMPSGEYDDPRAINADVMFIREHQGDINQIMLTDAGTITDIKTAYGVMRFNKWTINNKDKSTHLPLDAPASIYERSLYWVSFPFRVKLSEVFGFGTYGTHWILQYYDGAARAQYGMWAETGTYWKFIWDRKDFILEPNVGYLLTLETELMGEGSDIWGPNSRSSQVELYFPSYGDMPDITQADVVTHLEEHTCTIDRTGEGLPGGNDYRTTYDRRIVDSHWNVLSVPTYVNTDDVTFPTNTWTTTTRPKFLYTWNPDDNTITAASASKFTFHAMHAYMVQCYGNVTWSAKSGSPYPIVARSTYSEAPKEVEFCLELQQNEKMVDRTYISLSDDEDVSEGFAFNEDMTKEFSGNKPAIYTFIAGDVVAAGNTLPMTEQKTIVPVGVETKKAGDYTISIPEGTQGIGITLVDEETGVRTNLSALDYTINLPAGKHDNRFFLEISPIKTTPTGLEPTSDSSLKGREVRKVLIDQQMYIIKDGKMYDARGNLCK